MTDAVSESSAYQRLAQIVHPEIRDRNLVELGMIPEVHVTGNHVGVTLALPHLNITIKGDLVALVAQAVHSMAEDLDVEVNVTEMSPEQKKSFLAFAKADLVSSIARAGVGRVVAVMSGKGGVGKSSVSALLACALRRRGHKVGILDADITGPSIPMMFGVTGRPEAGEEGPTPVQSGTGIKLISINLLLESEDQAVIWRGPMISKVIEEFWRNFAWGSLDYLVVDLPPGTSDAAITVTQSLPLSGAILVTSPQDLAGMIVRKAASLIKEMHIPLIGVVGNMCHILCPECGAKIDLFGKDRAQATAQTIGTQLLGHLPLDPQIASLCDQGKIEDYRSEEFESIVEKTIPRVADKKRTAPNDMRTKTESVATTPSSV